MIFVKKHSQCAISLELINRIKLGGKEKGSHFLLTGQY
jgi:hypothetical protein